MSNVFYLTDFRAGLSPADGEHAPLPTASSVSLAKRQPLGLRRTIAVEAAKRLQPPPPPEQNPLAAATPILLFHTSYGRNAWQSTWIARYERNTLTGSHAAAKGLVAGKLKQGSAFRLVVTPGWHLQFDRRAYLVCEINSTAPFTRLRTAMFAAPGVMETEALAMLRPASELWRGAVPLHDSVIVQETKRSAGDFIAWSNRTSHPRQIRTPGRYQRVIDGEHWWFRAVNNDGPIDFDTTAFAALIGENTRIETEG